MQSENLGEKELFKKALGLPFPYPKCYDGITIEGNPKLRRCLNPQKGLAYFDKKTDWYIVDDPRVCGRCKARGLNEGEKPKAKPNPKPKHEKPMKEPSTNTRLNFSLGESEGLPPQFS